MLQKITIDTLRNVYKKKNYDFFEKGNYNLNIFGFRKYPGTVNVFDDVVGLAYMIENKWKLQLFKATTDPGLYYLKQPLNVEGTAILKEGQYKGTWRIGLHRGQYEALVQYKPVTVYRDRDKDNEYDLKEDTLQTGMFGINIHRATNIENSTSIQVDKWSAGCQVIAANNDFKKFMNVVRVAAEHYGDIFTYTLFNERDLG